jgi:hypothetical protein
MDIAGPSDGNEIQKGPEKTLEYKKLRFSEEMERLPVSMTERSKASTVFGRSNIGIAGSNPTRGMDVCLRLSVLCCPV